MADGVDRKGDVVMMNCAHKQNKPSLPGRKKKKDQMKRATTSEPHFCTLCRWQLCRRLTSKVENHWKM